MAVLKNRAKMSTSATGTGSPITLGSAEDGYQTFADAGVANADVVRYVIEDGNNWEIGTGTYTATGTTLSRTVSESSNADAAINLSGSATVFIGATAEDIPALYAANESSPSAQPSATGANAVAIGDSAVASGADALAFGDGATSSSTRSTAIGYNPTASGINSVAIGPNANSSWFYTVAIGSPSNGAGSVATSAFSAIAINGYASGTDSLAAAISTNSSSYGASGANSIAIGQFAKATQANSIAIGDTATSTTANQIALGGTTDTVKISGTYTLPTTDGTNGQVLTTDGSGAVTFADAGGGGADLYAANESSPSAQPSATGANAVAIGDSAVASGVDAAAIGNLATATGYRAFAGPKSSAGGQESVALGIGSTNTSYGAPQNFSQAIGLQAYASAAESTAIGNYAVSSGTRSVALGKSYASGSDSFAAAIANNTSSYGSSGANSIAMGKLAKATGSSAIALGWLSQSTAAGSVVIGSGAGQATANGAVSIGGYTQAGAKATGVESMALGNSSVAAEQGKLARACGHFGAAGDAQGGQFILRADTTDATATVLTSNNFTASSTNQIVANSDTCIMFSGTLVAMQNGAQDQGGWEIKGLLKNDGGTTTLVSSNIQTFADGNGWVVALTADNTNNALAITCTGEAAHNIRWVANIQTSEVTYA